MSNHAFISPNSFKLLVKLWSDFVPLTGQLYLLTVFTAAKALPDRVVNIVKEEVHGTVTEQHITAITGVHRPERRTHESVPSGTIMTQQRSCRIDAGMWGNSVAATRLDGSVARCGCSGNTATPENNAHGWQGRPTDLTEKPDGQGFESIPRFQLASPGHQSGWFRHRNSRQPGRFLRQCIRHIGWW